MTRKRTILSAALCALLLHCSSDKAKPSGDGTPATEAARHGLTAEQASQVLFEVGDARVTVGAFADRLHALSPYLRARYVSVERRREFLESMIRFELLTQEAQARGLLVAPDVVRTRQDAMVEAMMRKLFDEGELRPESIGDEEIAGYYEAHRDEFVKPAQVRASQIVVKDKSAAKQMLTAAMDDERGADGFAILAFKNSIDTATNQRGGDLRFFSEAEAAEDAHASNIPSAVRKAAFTLKEPGDVYEIPVESAQGYHVVMLTARRDAYQRTLEDAKPVIRNLLWREKRKEAIDAFVADLRKNAHVEEHLELLDSLGGAPADATAAQKGQTP